MYFIADKLSTCIMYLLDLEKFNDWLSELKLSNECELPPALCMQQPVLSMHRTGKGK